jgi:hypothetical protein
MRLPLENKNLLSKGLIYKLKRRNEHEKRDPLIENLFLVVFRLGLFDSVS